MVKVEFRHLRLVVGFDAYNCSKSPVDTNYAPDWKTMMDVVPINGVEKQSCSYQRSKEND